MFSDPSIDLLDDSGIPFLVFCPKEMKTLRPEHESCMFIVQTFF